MKWMFYILLDSIKLDKTKNFINSFCCTNRVEKNCFCTLNINREQDWVFSVWPCGNVAIYMYFFKLCEQSQGNVYEVNAHANKT